MITFFHGWRRKMGVVTLVLACLFMAAWGRSQISEDSVPINVGQGVTYTASLTRSGISVRKTQQIELNEHQSMRMEKNRFVILESPKDVVSQASVSKKFDAEGEMTISGGARMFLETDRAVLFTNAKDVVSQADASKNPNLEDNDERAMVISGGTTISLESNTVAVSYWSIIIPLTLLSAWLLLSKSRKKQQRTKNPGAYAAGLALVAHDHNPGLDGKVGQNLDNMT